MAFSIPTKRGRVQGSRPELPLRGSLVISVPRVREGCLSEQHGFAAFAPSIVSLLRLHASALLRNRLGS